MNDEVQVRSRGRLLLLLPAMLAGIVACSDEGPGGVTPPDAPEPPRFELMAVECSGSVLRRELTCAPAQSGLDPASAIRRGASPGRGGLWTASADPVADAGLIIGGQGVYVTLESSAITYDEAYQLFSFDVTVTNHIGQPLGTTDGKTLHDQGVRVFFQQTPVGLGGGGPFSVVADGAATFTAADQLFYQFDSILEPEQVSGKRRFAFRIPAETDFSFRVLVWAPVQWPDGWVAVTPASTALNLAVPAERSVALSATVYSRVGAVQADAITWSTSNGEVATVDESGVVTGVAAGSATITASAAGRASGTAVVTVTQPINFANSTLTTAAPTLTADGASTTTVTVQLKDAAGNNLKHDAGTVALSNSGDGALGAVSTRAAGRILPH